MLVFVLVVASFLHQPAGIAASTTESHLPVARYKSTCPVKYGDTLFVGQGIPGTGRGLVDIVNDIRWVSADKGPPLGFVLTSSAMRLFFVPDPNTRKPRNLLGGISYVNLGKEPLENAQIIAAIRRLYGLHLAGESLALNKCFSRPWDGTYPDGS